MSCSDSQTVSWASAAIGCGRVFVSLWLLLETVRFGFLWAVFVTFDVITNIMLYKLYILHMKCSYGHSVMLW